MKLNVLSDLHLGSGALERPQNAADVRSLHRILRNCSMIMRHGCRTCWHGHDWLACPPLGHNACGRTGNLEGAPS